MTIGSFEDEFTECGQDSLLGRCIEEPNGAGYFKSNILCNGTGLFHDLTIKEHFGKTVNHMEDFLILFETETKELTEIQANTTV